MESISLIMSDFEIWCIKARNKIFRDGGKNVKQYALNNIITYNTEIDYLANATLTRVSKVVKTEIEKSYNKGYKQTVAKIGDKSEQKEVQSKMQQRLILALAKIYSAVMIAKTVATNQYLQIVNQLPVLATNDIIDKVQKVFLKNGISGETRASGEINIVSVGEQILNNETQIAQNEGAGEALDRYNQHLVITTVHDGSCPICARWQGKVLIDDVYANGQPDGKHELLSTAIEDGFQHYNCTHNTIPFVEGVDKPLKATNQSKQEIAKQYSANQLQRYNERQIRAYKRIEAGAMTQNEREQANAKVQEWQAKQRKLAEMGEREGLDFYRQYSREQIGGETKPLKSKVFNYSYNIGE